MSGESGCISLYLSDSRGILTPRESVGLRVITVTKDLVEFSERGKYIQETIVKRCIKKIKDVDAYSHVLTRPSEFVVRIIPRGRFGHNETAVVLLRLLAVHVITWRFRYTIRGTPALYICHFL